MSSEIAKSLHQTAPVSAQWMGDEDALAPGDDGLSIEWNAASVNEWRRLFESVPYAAYQQAYAYGAVISKVGGEVHRAIIRCGGQPIALAQIQVRRFWGLATLATILRGPVWLEPENKISNTAKLSAYRLIKTTLPIRGLKALLVMPESDQSNLESEANLVRVVSAYHTVLIDLSADEEVLRKQLDGKWRNRLKAAEKANIDINRVGQKPSDYQWILEEERAQQVRAGYNALPSGFTIMFHQEAGTNAVIALEARLGTDRLGAVLFLRHGQAATYHIGWASEAGKAVNAHNLLLWRSMLILKNKGVGILDLGGLDTNQRPGIARFKLGTGGRLFSQSGAYCLDPSPL
ncbi:MAG: GNAT family N-acetyltransferase [Pseudomonadota bacterium]